MKLAVGRFTVAVLAATLMPAVWAGTKDHARPTRRATTVTIEGMQFVPQAITVHRGDQVVWANKDLFPHTALADGGMFNSRSISQNATWTYVAKRKGKFSYSCEFHPGMNATLIVQ